MRYDYYAEVSEQGLAFKRLADSMAGDRVQLKRYLPLDISLLDCLNIVESCLAPLGQTIFYPEDTGIYTFETQTQGGLKACATVAVHNHEANFNLNKRDKYYFTVEVVTLLEFHDSVSAALDARLQAIELAVVTWWYRSSRGIEHRDTLLDEPPEAKAAFYPWLGGGVDAYLDRYMASTSSILFLAGPPGTGKTSMLRWLLWRAKLHAVVTYDEDILGKDEIFVNFIFSNAHVFIVEDADDLLTDREHHGNKLVSRFLGASDGIVKLPKKKIIFTSNLSDLSKVDSALLRPGRCFDAQRFRALTYSEAVTAARAAGLSAPDEHRDYTLAEIFNPKEGGEFEHRKTGY